MQRGKWSVFYTICTIQFTSLDILWVLFIVKMLQLSISSFILRNTLKVIYKVCKTNLVKDLLICSQWRSILLIYVRKKLYFFFIIVIGKIIFFCYEFNCTPCYPLLRPVYLLYALLIHIYAIVYPLLRPAYPLCRPEIFNAWLTVY